MLIVTEVIAQKMHQYAARELNKCHCNKDVIHFLRDEKQVVCDQYVFFLSLQSEL